MDSIMPAKLHCYAVKENNQWVACCLDFSLATQAGTYDEAVSKLVNIIKEYIYDVTEGELKTHKFKYLNRKAPAKFWIKYYYFLTCHYLYKLFSIREKMHKLIDLSKLIHVH